MEPRDPSQRKADVLNLLETEEDAWVPSADTAGTPYLVPLSFYWDGNALVFATPTNSRTVRNLRRSGQTRIGLGGTRDVVMIDGPVEFTPIDDDPATADAFAARLNWDPRNESNPYILIRLLPMRIQAWREANELVGRDLMRDGVWIV